MKKLIFLLFPVFSYGQVDFTSIGGVINTINQSSYTISSLSYSNTKFYILVAVSTTSTTPNIATVTGTGITWTQIASVTFNTTGSPVQQLTIFRAKPSSATTTTLTVDYAGQTQNELLCNVFEFTGVVLTGTNGADAIVQSGTNSANSGANPLVTLSAFTGNRNTAIGFFSNDQAPFGATPESGWTQKLSTTAVGSPPSSYVQYRNVTTDNTASVTAAASNWGGIAVEIKASGRRATTIN